MWFRAMWDMVARKNGISAKDLQRLLGLGSYLYRGRAPAPVVTNRHG